MKVAIYDGKQVLGKILQSSRGGFCNFFKHLQERSSKCVVFANEPVGDSSFKDRPLHRFTQDLSQFDTLISINAMEPFFLLGRSRRIHFYCFFPQDATCMTLLSSFKYKYYVDGILFPSEAEALRRVKQFGWNKSRCYTGSRFLKTFLPGSRPVFDRISKNNQSFKQGVQAFRTRDYRRALKHFSASCLPEALLFSGFCYLKLQDWIHASDAFQQCQTLNPVTADASFGLALVQLSTGNLRKGLRGLIKARKKNRYHAETYLTINLINEQLGLDLLTLPDELQNDASTGITEPEFLFTVM